jgi:subtilisin-like proprotein convertase family protein
VVSLMLETNPNLTWRDVKEILITTAKKTHPEDGDWVVNGGGFNFNHKYGAGLVDAKAAVDAAATWVNLQPMSEFSQVKNDVDLAIPDNNATGVTFNFDPITDAQNMRVETVLVKVDITHTWRGEIELELISPSGKRSLLARPRAGDSRDNYDWTFSSVHHWGEESAGRWRLVAKDRVALDIGTINDLTLTFLGVSAPILGPPTFSVRDNHSFVTESSGQTEVVVLRTGALDSEVKVDYKFNDIEAVNGVDYTGVDGTLTFAVGESSKTVTVPILDDDEQEPLEKFSLSLSNPTGGGPDPEDVAQLGTQTTSTIHIHANDETLVTFQNIVYTWSEGQLVTNVEVERTRNLEKWSFVYFEHEDVTAVRDEDYQIGGRRVLFLPGQSVALIPVQVMSDGLPEGVETFRLHLNTPSEGADMSVSGRTCNISLSD